MANMGPSWTDNVAVQAPDGLPMVRSYRTDDAQTFCTGAAAGQNFHPGATIGQDYHAGATTGSCYG